ncbi:MAG TPA: hypothetical protein VMW83_06890 [Spirochaetia bacterium]|nr:hypothetical protein [Spirochaetia bacterium]
MRLNTCSAIIALAREMEEGAAVFYENLAKTSPADAGYFLGLARENRKTATNIERSYYGVITDAIEGSFTFDMAADEYLMDFALPADYRAALARAGEMEDKIIKFYRDAARQSQSLLADIPRVLSLAARKRETRKARLAALGDEGR